MLVDDMDNNHTRRLGDRRSVYKNPSILTSSGEGRYSFHEALLGEGTADIQPSQQLEI